MIVFFRRGIRFLYNRINRFLICKEIQAKYGASIKNFKDIHKGKRCFIIGNGPSLRISDLEKLKNEVTFAANKIFVAFEDTEWRPTYYCLQDFVLINEEVDKIEGIKAQAKFIAGNELVDKGNYLKDCIYFFLNLKQFNPKLPLFSQNPAKWIYEGYTVTYAEIQLAVYMGFTEIYLLGVDHNYAKMIDSQGNVVETDAGNYFSDKYLHNQSFGKELNYPNLDNSSLAYIAAEKYTREHGIKVYNATRGGKLETFQRIDFDTLLFN